MRPSSRLLLAALVACDALLAAPVPASVRVVPALALALVLPGLALERAIGLPKGPLAAVAISVPLSAITTIAVGFGLHVAGHLDRWPWLICLSAMTAIFLGVATLRDQRPTPGLTGLRR